ncbi:hypothetical protein [Nocardiopsis tropica]|uniref:Uncharacterized protein n=1 Tax=Nocardiopsis tropica TaxID=109330 RepID=A0ABU7KZY6_9ACTN|nr:hypothetical protein [Nocardiopsis umidischolae]MEE2054878.1 hypothetical protein [Nocardiopsis umidischolae]
MNDERDVGAEIDAFDRAMRRRWLRRRLVYWTWATVAFTLLGAVVGLVLDGVEGMMALSPWVFLASLFTAGVNLSFEVYMSRDAW